MLGQFSPNRSKRTAMRGGFIVSSQRSANAKGKLLLAFKAQWFLQNNDSRNHTKLLKRRCLGYFWFVCFRGSSFARATSGPSTWPHAKLLASRDSIRRGPNLYWSN